MGQSANIVENLLRTHEGVDELFYPIQGNVLKGVIDEGTPLMYEVKIHDDLVVQREISYNYSAENPKFESITDRRSVIRIVDGVTVRFNTIHTYYYDDGEIVTTYDIKIVDGELETEPLLYNPSTTSFDEENEFALEYGPERLDQVRGLWNHFGPQMITDARFTEPDEEIKRYVELADFSGEI